MKPGRVAVARREAPRHRTSPSAIFARGLLKRVVTRLYFPDEAKANDDDPVLARLTPTQRETLIAVPDGDALVFDIHLQGAAQTTFFSV